MNLLEQREGMPGLQAAGRIDCGQWKLQFLFQTMSPPLQSSQDPRGLGFEFGLLFPSLVKNFTLNLHLQRKPLPDVNFLSKPSIIFENSSPTSSKIVFSWKKGFVKNKSPNQKCGQGLSMAGASFLSGAPGDFHPAEQPPGLFVNPDLLITLQ